MSDVGTIRPWLIPVGLLLSLIGAILVWRFSGIWHDDQTKRLSQLGVSFVVTGLVLQLFGSLLQGGGPLSYWDLHRVAQDWILHPVEAILLWFMLVGWKVVAVLGALSFLAASLFLVETGLRPGITIGDINLREEGVEDESWSGYTYSVQGGDPEPQLLLRGEIDVINDSDEPVSDLDIDTVQSEGNKQFYQDEIKSGESLAPGSTQEVEIQGTLYGRGNFNTVEVQLWVIATAGGFCPAAKRMDISRTDDGLSYEAKDRDIHLFSYARLRIALILDKVGCPFWFSPRSFSNNGRIFDKMQ